MPVGDYSDREWERRRRGFEEGKTTADMEPTLTGAFWRIFGGWRAPTRKPPSWRETFLGRRS